MMTKPDVPFSEFPKIARYSREVVVSEKIDGCVPFTALISMADGSRKRIGQVVVGDEVLGVSRTGTITAAQVIRKFENGRADTWLKITGKRRGAGRGCHFFALRCTPEHRIYVADRKDYVKASELKLGDHVVMARSEMGLTPIQEQVLLGKMLGDGSLASTEWSAHISWATRRTTSSMCTGQPVPLEDLSLL